MTLLCMCCAECCRVHLAPRGVEHVISDASGKFWAFEPHPWLGPVVLRANGEPKARQPGGRSRFWPAYQAWADSRKQAWAEARKAQTN